MLGYFVIFLLVTLTHPTSMLGSEACLRKKLLQDYDKWARPVRNFSTAVELVFSAALYQHLGFDVKAETLKTLIWQRLTWTDELMRWDPKQHNDINEARYVRKLLSRGSFSGTKSVQKFYKNEIFNFP